MDNYLSKIEAEFSRGRGQASRLSPLDWSAAAKWESDGIPLHIVLSAMADGFKSYLANNQKGAINSIRYFIPAVQKQFTEWQTSQVGKTVALDAPVFADTNIWQETDRRNVSVVQNAERGLNIEILEGIADALPVNSLPAPLPETIAQIRAAIRLLIKEIESKGLDSDAIETRLAAERIQLEIALIAATSDDERAEIIAATKKDFGRFSTLPDVSQKLLIRRLRQKFNLPELTLFAL